MKKLVVVVICCFFVKTIAQKKEYKVRTIAFYNLENLFDTINNPHKLDDQYTPKSAKKWDATKYNNKLNHLADVISDIGRETTQSAPDIIGVAEVENEAVLLDLIHKKKLKRYNYGIIHRESADYRGIDVALIYKKGVFVPNAIKTYPLLLKNKNGKRIKTRDILLVSGFLDDEQIYVLVNHWPSRIGGVKNTQKKRISAAKLNIRIFDSIQSVNPRAKVIDMGDFNDNPNNKSLRFILRVGNWKFHNPAEKIFKEAIGTLKYRGTWFLFDQILFNDNLKNAQYKTYTYWKSGVFNKRVLITRQGRYKGYPFRSYSGNSYLGGYSDHFPFYIFIAKQ